MRDLRKFVSGLVIVSFSIAALLGIGALLGGGDFGDTEAQVLLTTVIVGFESVAVLCYLALTGHRLAVVGVAGALSSAIATALALSLTWGGDLDDPTVWQAFGVAVTVAASLAQASLLIALAGRRSLRGGLTATLLAIAVVAVMIVVPILSESAMGGDYWRAFGITAILDVLGTVVVTALGFFGRPAAEVPTLTPEVEARVLEASRGLGTSPSRLVSEALDAFLASARSSTDPDASDSRWNIR